MTATLASFPRDRAVDLNSFRAASFAPRTAEPPVKYAPADNPQDWKSDEHFRIGRIRWRAPGTRRSSRNLSSTSAFRPSRRISIRAGRRTATSRRVIRLAEAWVRQQPVRGMTVEIVRLPGRTPVLYFDVPGSGGIDGPAVRSPRQAARDDGLARRSRPVAAGARGRQALWPRRRRRRLRGVRLARRHRRLAGARHARTRAASA